MSVRIIVCRDSEEMAERGADEVARIARDSIDAVGQFNIALAGGSTPEKMYKLLIDESRAAKIDWSKVQIFFGDERFVPREDEERSNYAMAKRSLLSDGKIAEENVFSFDTTLPTVQQSALAYEKTLIEHLGKPPVFDLVLLGMGDDGHTASLFPHAATLSVQGRFVVDSPPGVLPPPVDRMTVTTGLLQHARNILLLVGGEKKAQAVRDALENHAPVDERPVASVLGNVGDVVVLLDEAAARMLSKSVEVSS